MKNTFKRIASMMLVVLMVFAMTIPAFADDADADSTGSTETTESTESTESTETTEGDDTSNEDDATETTYAYQYEIYQIFTGDYADGVLSNIKWGTNGTGTAGADVEDAVLEALADVATSSSDAEKLAVIEQYANLNSTAVKTANTNDNPYTVSDLANGYYLVKDATNSQEGESQAYTTYVVKVVNGTLTINRKADVPETTKKIVEGNDKVDANEASIGDTVKYEFTGDMPTNIADYDSYYYVFTDTLSKGLTLTNPNDFKVTVNGEDVTKYFHISATTDSVTGITTITVGIKDILALNVKPLTCTDTATDHVHGETCYGEAYLTSPITATTQVVVTYSAVLNENAVIGGEGNPNDVKLEYSNNPNDDGDGATTPPPENPDKPSPTTPTGETPKSEVVTYTTELIIKKTDEDGEPLKNAAFKITGSGVNIVVTTGEYFTEDASGTYYKLKDGSYTTTEPVTVDNPDTTDIDERNSDAYESITTKYKMETKVTLDTTGTGAVDAEAYVDSTTGLLKFTGLGVGTYTITETVTPAGYNDIAPMTVTINWDATNGFTYSGTDYEDKDNSGTYTDGDVYTNTVTIVNKAGSTLPETGGIGTTIFYICGGVLLVGAAVLLITKRRMNLGE